MEISAFINSLFPALDLSAVFSENPFIQTAQYAMIGIASVLVLLVFWTTRDIMRRTRSLLYQLGCILLVAAVPFVGFLLYFLVRPTQTLFQKDLHEDVEEALSILRRLEGEDEGKEEKQGSEENASEGSFTSSEDRKDMPASKKRKEIRKKEEETPALAGVSS